MQTDLRRPVVKIHTDAVKKRLVVHALDDEDWSPRFPRFPLAARDWTARALELIDESDDWLSVVPLFLNVLMCSP